MNVVRLALWCAVVGATLTAVGNASSKHYTSAAQANQDRPALSPAEALATFVVEPGYRIDLVAAEPLVQSPVAIAFDDRGARRHLHSRAGRRGVLRRLLRLAAQRVR